MSLNRRTKGLFLNPSRAQCSIHESGKMAYQALTGSSIYDLDYLEIDETNHRISNQYDFYLFNYHNVTMGWLDSGSVRRLPGIKMTLVLEVMPGNPFVLCPSGDFDVYLALDPTLKSPDRRVYSFPRPLERAAEIPLYKERDIPVIGTFGFATPGKGFELVVDAVNREFETAVIRMNIPGATYADPQFWKLHQQNYSEYLAFLCGKVAKKGVKVAVTHHYMTKQELIQWCGQNTLNCFLYNRNQPGLSATTDQAISSGRPLAVSSNETFRHIHPYVMPYPFMSLREAMANSAPQVMKMQQDWSPERFSEAFEAVLKDVGLPSPFQTRPSAAKIIELKKKDLSACPGAVQWIKSIARRSGIFPRKERETNRDPVEKTSITGSPAREKILIVSHKEKQCGIHQYGINISDALSRSRAFAFAYQECSEESELHRAVNEHRPRAIIYNYYPTTMAWLNKEITGKYALPQLGIMHEVTQEESDKATREMFKYHLCPDPTLEIRNPCVIKTKRLIPSYINTQNQPDEITIGSFGFGFRDKGFERLIETVQNEFDRARIILHMPFNDIVDREGKSHALETAKRCRKIVKKPGIRLEVNHHFLNKKELLDFLAGNTLNAFFYDVNKYRGISSVIEHALAVQRPVAITKCGMFRHVYRAEPSICIEDSSLSRIIGNDIIPLVPYFNEWSQDSFIRDYEMILDRVIRDEDSKNNPVCGGRNDERSQRSESAQL